MALYELSDNNDSTHHLRIASPLAATTVAVRRGIHNSGTSLMRTDDGRELDDVVPLCAALEPRWNIAMSA